MHEQACKAQLDFLVGLLWTQIYCWLHIKLTTVLPCDVLALSAQTGR